MEGFAKFALGCGKALPLSCIHSTGKARGLAGAGKNCLRSDLDRRLEREADLRCNAMQRYGYEPRKAAGDAGQCRGLINSLKAESEKPGVDLGLAWVGHGRQGGREHLKCKEKPIQM